MIKGHLSQQYSSSFCSMKPKPCQQPTPASPTNLSMPPDVDDGLCPSKPNNPFTLKLHFLYAHCKATTGQIYTDPVGHFLTLSTAENSYMLILYHDY
jgi:hypothetical protein